MKTKTTFPHRVREIENQWIVLEDGTRLAARIWLPEDAESKPVPAILEYLPYRKRDGTAVRDELTHPYFAGHGYACVRVDMRGNGESDGLMEDEYAPQEQRDALEVIDWIAAQPWCDGKLGMMGISWGGFNSLQLAALRPEPLKAIITLCSTDDRYADDIHYKGGNMLLENLGWSATMLSFSAAVPDPALVGDRWREMWKHRLDNMPLLAETWLEHQHRDDYWKHGSVCENYADIEAAVYMISGWADSYIDTIPRMMEHLSCPKKALIGPWMHKYPHFAIPDPAIGFLQEALRWWDYWLKDTDTGIMDEPECTFYLQDGVPPAPKYLERPGQWVRTHGWPAPSDEVETQSLVLGDHGLGASGRLSNDRLIASPLTAGSLQGEYIPLWFGADFPPDQRRDDGLSLTFDSAPYIEGLDILGQPTVKVTLASAEDCGQFHVRLCDVAPSGESALITYATLNLNLRDDPGTLTPPVPGEPMDIRLPLDLIGYRLPPGHRLRVALSSASFPLVWSPKKRADLTLQAGTPTLELPVSKATYLPMPFEAPESAPPCRVDTLRAGQPKRTISEDVGSGEVTVTVEDDMGDVRFEDHGLRVEQNAKEVYTSHPSDATRTRADIEWVYRASRDEGEGRFAVEVTSRYHLHCDEDTFYLSAEQIAHEGETLVSEKTWQREIPRSAI
ncbi:CocE/NonD family hydrolase [Chromohalobacter canadensis]|uniref:CocE/NonD family hydrolase n=1 Tax=Chromohalobacter canadensis TaxID=141389 RepID=UPI0021BF6391|nr:CocE/NonD family hydrolase [Chromohalobacter canadensis]MCT8467291.1 CocE/NonD family hydrolase [Chromohalobacter canadensis]MCT8470961.1 CocE/NonD family hydrolase [Chromohalobacter canadensis]MCT8497788.1 CocE/NonD family hydrolase [Chromohalobacter canadensis]